MSPAAWGALAAVVGPAIGFITWLLTRRHRETIEDTASMTEAMGAITDANINIAAVVQSLITPLQTEVTRLAANEAKLQINLQSQVELTEKIKLDHQAQLDLMKAEQADLQIRFTSIIRYVNILRRQLVDVGHEPAPIPEDLDLSGFNFD